VSRTIKWEDLPPNDRALIDTAFEASFRAYAPYSGVAVGAAVRTKIGGVYYGANMENASIGVTICAEVSALTAANSAGDFELETIAIVGHKFTSPADSSQVFSPCGRCRQLIQEAGQIARTDVRVLFCNGGRDQIVESLISKLLPHAFGPKNLGIVEKWHIMKTQLDESARRLIR
jgi:cytidine deaminase